MASYVTDRGFFWEGGGENTDNEIFSNICFLTISNAFESPLWTWILVSHMSRGCIPVSPDYVKCRQYFRHEKLKIFNQLKMSV